MRTNDHLAGRPTPWASHIVGRHLERTKDLEDVFGKLFWAAEGEELLVDARELFLVELARRAVLEESLVPVDDKAV
jgi:hypothetical protein